MDMDKEKYTISDLIILMSDKKIITLSMIDVYIDDDMPSLFRKEANYSIVNI